MNILIWTDLEGVSGIVDFDKHEELSEKDKFQRVLMTGEVNAAIKACFDSGATKVKVIEGHDSIDINTLDERATFVPARYPAISYLQGWEGYEYIIFIGCHAMAGTKDGVLSHTGNRTVKSRKINGEEIGEVGTAILQAGEYGIKALMVSGDEAVCREIKNFSNLIFTAPVKKGYDMFHAECLHPKKARKLIYNTVIKAIKRKYLFKPIKIDGEAVFEETFYSEDKLKSRKNEKFNEIIDKYTIRYYGSTLNKAYGRRCNIDIKEY